MNYLQTSQQLLELGVIPYSDQQPLTPEEQLVVMLRHEEEVNTQESLPTEMDLEVSLLYVQWREMLCFKASFMSRNM